MPVLSSRSSTRAAYVENAAATALPHRIEPPVVETADALTSLDVPSRASSSMFTTGHAVCGAPARSLKVPLAVKALAIPERLVTPVACTSARVGARSETKCAPDQKPGGTHGHTPIHPEFLTSRISEI